MNMASTSVVSAWPWHTEGLRSHCNMPPSKVPEMILAVGRAVLPAGAGKFEFAGPAPVVTALVVVTDLVVVVAVVVLVLIVVAGAVVLAC